jgi:hypothetical protein
VEKLIGVLELTRPEQESLHEAVEASQRKITVPNEATVEVYWLCHKLRKQIDQLHPIQIELIETALSLPNNFNLSANVATSRLKRRNLKVGRTEAKM